MTVDSESGSFCSSTSRGETCHGQFDWIRALLGKPSIRRRNATQSPAMGLVTFEQRRLLSASAAYDGATHTLTVNATGSESMTLGANASGQVFFNKGIVKNGDAALLAGDVHSIVVNGGNGK